LWGWYLAYSHTGEVEDDGMGDKGLLSCSILQDTELCDRACGDGELAASSTQSNMEQALLGSPSKCRDGWLGHDKDDSTLQREGGDTLEEEEGGMEEGSCWKRWWEVEEETEPCDRLSKLGQLRGPCHTGEISEVLLAVGFVVRLSIPCLEEIQ
jgi:hypothetical protein